MCFWGLWLCLVWTLTLAGGSIPSYFLLFGELSLLWFFSPTVGQPQWAWHRRTSSQQLSQEEEVLCIYANLLLCVWRHSAGSIHPVPSPLWVSEAQASFLQWSGVGISLKPLYFPAFFFSLLVRHAIDQTHSLGWHVLHLTSACFFVVFKWIMHKTDSSCLQQITLKGRVVQPCGQSFLSWAAVFSFEGLLRS